MFVNQIERLPTSRVFNDSRILLLNTERERLTESLLPIAQKLR